MPEFASEAPYSRFAVYAILKHGGDYRNAARELARQGYGERPALTLQLETLDQKSIRPVAAPQRQTDLPVAEVASRPFKWMSELAAQPDESQWLEGLPASSRDHAVLRTSEVGENDLPEVSPPGLRRQRIALPGSSDRAVPRAVRDRGRRIALGQTSRSARDRRSRRPHQSRRPSICCSPTRRTTSATRARPRRG